MRLMNSRTYELREFFKSTEVKYAILSHRWEEEEISYAQLTVSDFPQSKLTGTKGWRKIKNFCAKALSFGIEWVWVDTCCIDKSSSAELSEAINSMYRWYADAIVCLVFMSDVMPNQTDTHPFEQSKWFTRGWTLQELLAPSELNYYDSNWEFIGTRKDLCRQVSKITEIPLPVLYNPERYRIEYTSVAQRMSWISRRHTTRDEDISYCLLGIFKVNMPLLYGEGAEKSFQRLQLEILSKSGDESIFAWTPRDEVQVWFPMLAPLPELFAHSGDVRSASTSYSSASRRPSNMTNWGLSMHHPLCAQSTILDYLIRVDFRPQGLRWLRYQSNIQANIYGAKTMCMPIACTHHGKRLAVVMIRKESEEGHYVYIRGYLATLREEIDEALLSWHDIYVLCQEQLEPRIGTTVKSSIQRRIPHVTQLITKSILENPINEQHSMAIFEALDFEIYSENYFFKIALAPGAECEELCKAVQRLAFVSRGFKERLEHEALILPFTIKMISFPL